MEHIAPFIPYLITGIFGGAVLTTLINQLFERKGKQTTIQITQEDQTLKWSAKALEITEELIAAKMRYVDASDVRNGPTMINRY
jgi:hypothetical protein